MDIINLSGQDHSKKVEIGEEWGELIFPRGKFPHEATLFDYNYYGPGEVGVENIYGKATGTLYSFNLRFTLKN